MGGETKCSTVSPSRIRPETFYSAVTLADPRRSQAESSENVFG